MKEQSYAFFRSYNFVIDRLDENFNNPRFDHINELLKKVKYKTIELSDKKENIITYIASGKTPPNIHYQDEGVPFLGATNLHNEKVDTENAEKILPEIHEEILASTQIKKNDVLVSIAGTIGLCAVYDSDEECNCNQAITILRINEEKVNPFFLMRYLHSELGQLFFEKLQHVSSQPNINNNEIGKIIGIFPEKDMQNKIIKELQPYGVKIQEIEKEINEIKEKIENSLLNKLEILPRELSYFYKTGKETSFYFITNNEDIKDRLHLSYYTPKQSIMKELTDKYETISLKKITVEPIRRGQQPEYSDDGITVIKTVDLKNSRIETELKVSEDFFEKYPDGHVKKNDVLIASTGYCSIGKVDVYDSEEQAIVDGHVSIVRLKDGFNPYFITYFLRSMLGKIQFDKWWTGSSGQIEIQPHDLEKFIVPDNTKKGIPIDIQNEIANELNICSIELDKVNTKYKEQLRLRNKSFLQQLIKDLN